MYCNICPIHPLVEAVVASYGGDFSHPLQREAFSRIGELRDRCTACHFKAWRHAEHLGPDHDGGRLHGEVSLNDAIFAASGSCGDFTIPPDYFAKRSCDTTSGCTAELSPDTEDALRKAVAVIAAGVEVADAAVLLSVLKREPLAIARGNCDIRAYAVRVRSVLKVVNDAKAIIKTDRETRHAAAKLVNAICSSLTRLEAPVVLGMLQRKSLAEIARAAGLRNRATVHERARKLLARLPQLKPLHSTAAKARKSLVYN